jgi:hypothetical protein
MDSDDKLNTVIRSLSFLLDLMSPSDELSLLTFANDVNVRFKQLKLTAENKEVVRFALQQLRARGGTNLSGALLTTRECLSTDTTAPLKQGILLLTDGHANVGPHDLATLSRQATNLLADYRGLTLSCVGYGTDHNAELLTTMAAEGGGSYNVVANLEDVATVFGDILGGLQATVAQELKVQVPLTSTQITLFPGHPTLFLGDLQAGGEHVVLLKDVPAAAAEPFHITAYETASGRPLSVPVSLSAPTDAEHLFGQIAVLRLQVVEFLKNVNTYLQSRDASNATALEAERGRLLTAVDTLSVEPSPLLTLLKEELLAAEQYLRPIPRSPHYARQTSTIVSQHVAHLGYARGVRCSEASPYREGAGAGAAAAAAAMPPCAPALVNTFSSPCQRTVSNILRQSTGARPMPTQAPMLSSDDMDEID